MNADPAPLGPPKPLAVACAVGLIVVFCHTVGGLAAARVKLFHAGWDLAIYHQTVWLLAHGQEQWLTTRELTVFGHHLHLILWPVALLYRWLPTPLTLTWLQTIATGLAAVPAFLLARELSRSDAVGVAWVAIFLSYPSLQHMALHDFHCEPLALPFFTAALYLAHRERWVGFGIALALAVTAKEDAGLAVASLGVGLFLAGRRRVGGITAAAGMGYMLLALLVVMPRLAGPAESGYYVREVYSHLGSGPVQIALSPILRPGAVLRCLLQADNARLLAQLLLPLALLPLLKPTFASGAAVTLFLNMVSNNGSQRSIQFHYQGFVMPFLLMAAVAGGAWLSQRLEAKGWRRATALALPPALAAMGTFVLPVLLPGVAREPATSPLQAPALVHIWAQQHPWAAEAERLAASIPEDASVAASSNLLPRVAGRKLAYLFPDYFWSQARQHGSNTGPLEGILAELRTQPVEYLLVRTEPSYPSLLSLDDYQRLLDGLVAECGYRLVNDAGPVRLYRRVS